MLEKMGIFRLLCGPEISDLVNLTTIPLTLLILMFILCLLQVRLSRVLFYKFSILIESPRVINPTETKKGRKGALEMWIKQLGPKFLADTSLTDKRSSHNDFAVVRKRCKVSWRHT